MHEKNIDILRDEAIRLLSVHQDIVRKMCDSGLLNNDDDGQTLTENMAIHRIEELKGEANKVEKLEMVVAVIGTMKAGKSTTINAIVGNEIVPARSHPMTALPTMIRHRPGQRIPKLIFQNSKPLTELARVLAEKLRNPPRTREYEDFIAVPDGARLTDEVLSGAYNSMDTEAEGAEAISLLLKRVNDFVRLSRVTGVPFPYHEYDEVHEFPVIEVEFFHLPAEGGSGQFTLLDTPGPNEAGHSDALTDSLRKQLQRSSAILVVMDFTQLNSEADDEIRQELAQVLGGSQDPNRVYVIVNKYDQRTKNDTVSVEELKRQLAQRLSTSINGRRVELSPDQIFLVSSQRAFLANRAGRALDQGELDLQTQPWLEDFATLAYGAAWDEGELEDKDELASRVNSLFKKSGFQAPLDKVIRHGHQFAALNSLRSAAQKLGNNSNDVGNIISARDVGLKKSAEELQRDIADLENDIRSVEGLETELNRILSVEMVGLKKSCRSLFDGSRSRLETSVQGIFAKESTAEAERQKNAERDRLGLLGSLASILTSPSRIESNRKAVNDRLSRGTDLGKGVIKYTDRDDAMALIREVRKEVEKEIGESRKELISNVDAAKKKYSSKAGAMIKDRATPLFEDIKSRLHSSGYEITLSLPDMDGIEIDESIRNDLDFTVQKKTETVRVKQSGAGGWLKRGFGSLFGQDDWGHDDVERDYYPVDFNALAKKVQDVIKSYVESLDGTLDSYISDEIEEKQAQFFSDMKKKLENVRGDLRGSQKDKEKLRVEQEKIIISLRDLKKKLANESDALTNFVALLQANEVSA